VRQTGEQLWALGASATKAGGAQAESTIAPMPITLLYGARVLVLEALWLPRAGPPLVAELAMMKANSVLCFFHLPAPGVLSIGRTVFFFSHEIAAKK
jgi:hypothetical protein